MASLMCALWLTCLAAWNTALATIVNVSIHQEGGLKSANAGDTVTLQCFCQGDKAGVFKNEFRNNSRFSLDTSNSNYHLTISDLRFLDSATYYCAISSQYTFKFGDGITVSVQGSGSTIPALVHQSVSGSLRPGGSVTLNCTVHTGTCDGTHSVYWFRDSGQTQPGIIYTHGDRNDQCERKPDTQTHTCVYNLPLTSLSPSHAGTYYCAVASCGHILFGNGTKLDVRSDSLVLVYFLGGALAITTTLTVLLSLSVHRVHKGNSCKCTDSQAPATVDAEVDQDEDNLHYAAFKKQRFRSARHQKEETHCVYSTIKL